MGKREQNNFAEYFLLDLRSFFMEKIFKIESKVKFFRTAKLFSVSFDKQL